MSLAPHKLFSKLFIWLVLEILLSILNLDDLADYVEFLSRTHHTPIAAAEIVIDR